MMFEEYSITQAVVTRLVGKMADVLDIDSDEIAVRTNYSGRSMYGRTCLAFVPSEDDGVFVWAFGQALSDLATEYDKEVLGSSDVEASLTAFLGGPDLRSEEDVTFLDSLADGGPEIVRELVRSLRQDSMGMGSVFYIPSISVEALADGEES